MEPETNGHLPFSENRIFEYNRIRKILFGVMVIFAGIAAAAFIAAYYAKFRHSDFFIFSALSSAWASISKNIADSTLLGVAYTSLIGGLFFVVLPIEVFIARFFSAGNSFAVVFVIYMAGIFISYAANYFIGMKLSGISKKMISPKKFYKTKGILNRYGGIAVYVFNFLPLPSQPLSVILGVFRYNKARFFIYMLLGHASKFTAIWLGAKYLIL